MNIPFDISQTKTRTLILGAVFATATVLSGSFAGAGLLIQAVGEVSGNIGANDLGEMIKRFRQKQKILDDPHLTLAVGKAIGLVILNLAEDDESKDELAKLAENKHFPYPFIPLRKLATNTETKWIKLSKKTISGSHDIDIRETDLVTMFANDVESFKEIKALEIYDWEQILRWLADKSGVSLHEDVINYVARKLCDEFPQRFRDVLKHDADNGGEAFAQMLLNLHGEALSTLKELKKGNQQIVNKLEKISKTSEEIADNFRKMESRFNNIDDLLRELINIFPYFNYASVSLSQHIRLREFKILVDEKTKNFVGREFIFRTIDDFLQKPDFSSGYIVISGEPGIGKSSIMAQLVKRFGAVHHFNIAPQNIRSPRDFLANICAQIIVRYELDYSNLPSEATKDSGFLSQLLQEIANKEQHPLVVLVDALDEAEDIGLPLNANRLYLPRILPGGVYFIVTSREEHDYRLDVKHRKDIYLRDDDPLNLEDINQYILYFVEEHRSQIIPKLQQWKVDEDKFVDVVTTKSEGNFMYLVYILQDICNGRLATTHIKNINEIPKGLDGYYKRHWRQMKSQDEKRFEKYYEPVVCMLATVREPVSVDQIAAWTKLQPMRIKEVIQTWRQFLNEIKTEVAGEFLYRVYHSSFRDFLKEEVGLTSYHDNIAKQGLKEISKELGE